MDRGLCCPLGVFVEQESDVTFNELNKNLVDINRPDLIPDQVMSFFYSWKELKGSIPTGIAHIVKKGWYIVSPTIDGNGVIKHFPENI